MRQEEFVRRFEEERGMYEAWGKMVTDAVIEALRAALPGGDLKSFLKMPAEPRVKSLASLVAKAFFRGFEYNTNPYDEITDKVGTRFVVLLLSDIDVVSRVVEGCTLWGHEQSRDFREYRRRYPTVFEYQSVHYIVRAAADHAYEGGTIKKGTPCEIQIRTLMQHAYSEVSHDTVYKPDAYGIPEVHRILANSMSLIENADDAFMKAHHVITQMRQEADAILGELTSLYREVVDETPWDDVRANLFVLRAIKPDLQEEDLAKARAYIEGKEFIGRKVRERAQRMPLFKLPAVLFTYYLIGSGARNETAHRWPLDEYEFGLICGDLGFAPAH